MLVNTKLNFFKTKERTIEPLGKRKRRNTISGGPKISILGMPKPPEQWLTKNRVVIEVSRRSLQWCAPKYRVCPGIPGHNARSAHEYNEATVFYIEIMRALVTSTDTVGTVVCLSFQNKGTVCLYGWNKY